MSRKYRHQGYQDSDREPDRERGPRSDYRSLTPEEKIQRRSLRRATQREANEVVRCHHCGRSAAGLEAIAPDTRCPYCRTPLHCCRTCNHFDSASRWQCRAEIPQAIPGKSEANDCAHYRPRLVLDATGRRSQQADGKSDDPRSQFENLFKK